MTRNTNDKRKWAELGWEIVMEAQTFVAVYAASGSDDDVPDEPPTKSKKTNAKKTKKASKTANKSKKATPTPSGRETRSRGKVTKKKGSQAADEVGTDADDGGVAVEPNAAKEAGEADVFWLAELRDDVTEDMLDTDIGVHIRWLNKRQGNVYEYAFDDVVDLQTILCHVYMKELHDGALELTAKSLARVTRCVQRTRGELLVDGDDAMEDDDDEKPPPSKRKTRAAAPDAADDGDGEGHSKRRRGGGAGKEKKLSKREEAMHIPPKYAKVDASKYEDGEIYGKHALQLSKDDTMATSKEVVRAVVTKNHKLLKKLTEDKAVYKQIHSFSMQQSVNVAKTALHHAVEADDLAAAALLLKARKLESKLLAKKPEMSLPSHSTGKHTSSFSDYNRRAINASRGGKEGNNALMEDQDGNVVKDEDSFLWDCNTTSVQMLTLFYPTGEWSSGYSVPYNVAKVCRSGNYKLAYKLIETLNRNGGWGFNELHCKVLSDSDEPLPAFRSVSAIKQATQTKIRPLHLAAINPNTKYLETLWDSAGDEWSSAKDDLAFEPIHFAAVCESTAPLAFLLERKCNMFARTKRRQTPIMRAIAAKRDENAIFIMEKALEQGDDVRSKVVSERGPGSFQPIHYAARHGCAKVLGYLLQNGADANSVCEGKMTPLCLAARAGHYDCVAALLDHGAKVNVGDKLKKTPLIFAVKNGHTRIAALLINSGANVNAFDTSENSVVHYAASYGWKSCVELLFDTGADFWAKNSWGFVPLTCALLKQRLLCSEFILERDPNQHFLDFRDRQGCTMLFLQCSHSKNVSQIKYLLDKGLNPNIPNSDGVYPLQVLLQRAEPKKGDQCSTRTSTSGDDDDDGSSSFYDDAIRLLLANKAAPHYDVEVKKCVPGLTDKPLEVLQPLQIAIQRNLQDVFQILLTEYDADPTRQSSNGMDAWMAAACAGSAGEFFLESLMKRHTKIHKTKKHALTTVDIMGDNIFHCIAGIDLDGVVSPALVRELLAKCQHPAALMDHKNEEGHTPLQRLIGRERAKPSKDISLPEHADLLEAAKRNDERYSEIVEIFAEYAKTEDSWVQYVEESKAKNEAANAESRASTGDAASEAASDKGSTEHGDDEEDEDDDNSGSEDGDDNDNSGSEDGDDNDEDADATPTSGGPQDATDKASRKMVKHMTILHAAANRTLRADAKKTRDQWFGSNLVTVLLTKIRFDDATINFADYASGKTALLYAVQRGDRESVAALLKNRADPNHSPVKCESCTTKKIPCQCARDLIDTALVVAVRNNDLDVVRLLLQSGRTDVNCYEKTSLNRPLHLCLAANNPEITTILLDYKSDLSKLNSSGESPLHVAVRARHSVNAKQPHEGEVDYTKLDTTQGNASTSLSAISVALQSDQAKHVVMSYDAKKRTPVHCAAANRDIELLRALVGASANKKTCVNKTDQFGRTPLHFAVNASSMSPDASFEVERFLLQSGADANAVDAFKLSALHFALFKVDFDWHFRYDTDKDKAEAAREREDGTYDTKKSVAFLEKLAKIPSSETDPVETVSNLTSIRGIKADAQDVLGRTALHLAAATGAFVCASAVLSVHENTADKKRALAITDKDKFTPLGRAVENLRQTTIMTLLQSGAEVDGHIMVKEKPSDNLAAKETEKPVVKTYSYFYHAVKNSLTGICHMLLNAKFSKRQAVEDAVLCGQFQLASNLMVGIEVSGGGTLLTKANSAGDTLLHSLARVDKPFDDLARSIAWSFVDAGLKANQTNALGCTPLHYAAEMGNIHLMDFLLHNKCDLNARNKAGETPLVFALKRSRLKPTQMVHVLKYCVEKPSVDLRAADKHGANALSAFLDRFVGHPSFHGEPLFKWIETLLKKGVDPNGLFTSCRPTDFFCNELFGSSTEVQMPPVIRVVYAGTSAMRCSLLGLLLRFGAKINTADRNGNSLLMHLAAGNMVAELHLALGKTKTVRDPVDPKSKKLQTIHVPANDIKQALAQTNTLGQSVLHVAVKPLAFGSHESTELLELLISSGASLQARDHANKTPVDYTMDQSSRFLYRFLHSKYPTFASKDENEVFDADMEEWEVAPDYKTDAAAYIAECESNGTIAKTKVHPEPNTNCDVGSLKRVFGLVDDQDKVVSGEEYDALLTKVDVKNGRFGLNVFYRCQIVQDQIQGIYVVFTNWGRIGEEGKFQNTPFHVVDDAVAEFKKIFKSKTGNHWHERHAFVKHSQKYNLVQRVNYHTKVSDEITVPFVEAAAAEKQTFAPSKRDFAPSVSEMLFAITDVRNLQLAATESANFHGSLPLANAEELTQAVARLVAIRDVIETRDKLTEEMDKVRGDMSDGAASQLTELAQQHTSLTEDVSEKSSRYYEVMPCDEDAFGSSITAFNTVADVNKEITRLRMLIDITHTYKMLLGAKRFQSTVHPLDYCYDALQVNLAPLAKDAPETTLLTKWFFHGLRAHDKSNYRISNVFHVSRNGEKTRFMDTLASKPTLQTAHSQLLWHGTKRTNLMGILSQGLRIAPPEAPHHGYMYGKGLYFANVAAKSLAYCDSGYVITSKTKDAEGQDVAKTRNVHYLLACQVALGTSKELSGGSEYGKAIEGVESVHALGQHLPDPSGSIVSPLSGAALPLGKVGQIGVAFPFASVWAKTACSPMPYSWYERDPKMTIETQQIWDKIAAQQHEGTTYTVEEDDKKHFLRYNYEGRTITIEVLTKHQSTGDGGGSETALQCDVTLQITFTQESQASFGYQVKRFRNAYLNSPLDDGFEMLRPQGPEYDELIVYDEGQARIRYLVEVETL